jgi:transcriptional regulator with XRE-family HTH domain
MEIGLNDGGRSTREAMILKHLRQTRKLSVRNAAAVIGVSDAYVNHAENGRSDLNPKIILRFLNSYGYSYEQFMEYMNEKKDLPTNDYADCIEILKRLDKSKLKTVKAILESF